MKRVVILILCMFFLTGCNLFEEKYFCSEDDELVDGLCVNVIRTIANNNGSCPIGFSKEVLDDPYGGLFIPELDVPELDVPQIYDFCYKTKFYVPEISNPKEIDREYLIEHLWFYLDSDSTGSFGLSYSFLEDGTGKIYVHYTGREDLELDFTYYISGKFIYVTNGEYYTQEVYYDSVRNSLFIEELQIGLI